MSLYASVVSPRCNDSRQVHVHCFLDAADYVSITYVCEMNHLKTLYLTQEKQQLKYTVPCGALDITGTVALL